MPKSIIIALFGSIILLGVFFFFFAYPSFDLKSSDSFHFDNDKLSKVASDIIGQNQIFEMDDCSRYQKYLNGVGIRMTEAYLPEDTNCCRDNGYCCPKYYKTVLDSLKINSKLFNKLKDQLSDTELYSFYKSRDSVLFIVDGFLDSDWGYMYSSKELTSDTNYFYFGNHRVKFVDSVNRNWRRAAIR